jgi:hypothetical protein
MRPTTTVGSSIPVARGQSTISTAV